MKFKMIHSNRNVLDLEKSLAFYKEALDFNEVSREVAEDGSFIIAFLEGGADNFKLELTWIRDREEPYNLGENEIHLAVQTEDYEAALAHHKALDCVCFINEAMGIYFINDPDGYWIEIVPAD
jgi:lactoylglutathione lyase